MRANLKITALKYPFIRSFCRGQLVGEGPCRVHRVERLANKLAPTEMRSQRRQKTAVGLLPFNDVEPNTLFVELANAGLGYLGDQGNLAGNCPLVDMPIVDKWR